MSFFNKIKEPDFDFKKLIPESFTNSSSNYVAKEIKESDTYLTPILRKRRIIWN